MKYKILLTLACTITFSACKEDANSATESASTNGSEVQKSKSLRKQLSETGVTKASYIMKATQSVKKTDEDNAIHESFQTKITDLTNQINEHPAIKELGKKKFDLEAAQATVDSKAKGVNDEANARKAMGGMINRINVSNNTPELKALQDKIEKVELEQQIFHTELWAKSTDPKISGPAKAALKIYKANQ